MLRLRSGSVVFLYVGLWLAALLQLDPYFKPPPMEVEKEAIRLLYFCLAPAVLGFIAAAAVVLEAAGYENSTTKPTLHENILCVGTAMASTMLAVLLVDVAAVLFTLGESTDIGWTTKERAALGLARMFSLAFAIAASFTAAYFAGRLEESKGPVPVLFGVLWVGYFAPMTFLPLVMLADWRLGLVLFFGLSLVTVGLVLKAKNLALPKSTPQEQTG